MMEKCIFDHLIQDIYQIKFAKYKSALSHIVEIFWFLIIKFLINLVHHNIHNLKPNEKCYKKNSKEEEMEGKRKTGEEPEERKGEV